MVTVVRIAAAAVLVCIAVEDIRYKKISGIGIWIFLTLNSILLVMMECTVCEKLVHLAGGTVVGGIFYGIAAITGEAIGKGDAFLILSAGVSLGCVKTSAMVLLALILVLLYGIPGVIRCRNRIKQKVAFVPFLCLAYSIVQKGMVL